MVNNQIEVLEKRLDELQTQLMQAQKLGSVGAIASSITHEFNNILTTVINYAKMGLRHEDPAIREKAFTKILNAGQRASKITTGMLKYARTNSNVQEPMDIVEIVQQCLLLVEKDLQIHKVSVDTQFEDKVWSAVNSGQIQQVLLNLIVNARQAMDTGGTLRISVTANDGYAEIGVRDSGCGIPAESLPRIFEQFYSTKDADAAGQGGTGLGLAVCRDIIESHNGRIRVESTVGKGTKFTLRMPLLESPAGLIRTSEPQLSATS